MKNIEVEQDTLEWLLSGDVSIIYQAKRDLLHAGKAELKSIQARISKEGWGSDFLKCRGRSGLWGDGFYLPKWTSTHYTLLDLKHLCFPVDNEEVNKSVLLILDAERAADGGISYSRKNSDVCVNGMILDFGSYFIGANETLDRIVDFLLATKMLDGGWNCKYNKGATHSSLHSTLSVLEGLAEYGCSGNTYRINEIVAAKRAGIEFLLRHRLFKSHHTGEIIDPKMLQFSYPSRWRYDILRALDYLQKEGIAYDKRMEDALVIVREKQGNDGAWKLEKKHNGLVHFDMEKTGSPGRWNTLRALRVLRFFQR